MAGISGDDLIPKGFLKMLDEAYEKTGKLDVNLGKLEETLRKGINEGFDRLSKELKDVSVGATDTSSKLADLDNRVKRLKTTSAQLETELSKLRKTQQLQEKQLEDLRADYDRLSSAQTRNKTTTAQQSAAVTQLTSRFLSLSAGIILVERGARLLTQQIRAAITSNIEFEQAMREVQAISRATSDQFKSLEADANRLGASTEKTAGQVAKLQKELAKLGFAPTEIIASADAIIDLSTATGEDLVNSATVAASTLRAFGLEAVEMTRLVDTMAGSFVRSGLDLNKFQESMKLVAPLARAANVDLETTTAALSKLADAGLSGSLAGTALRNLISEMADPTSELAERLGFVVGNSEDMITAFRQLKEEGVGLADAVQMVDVRARPAFFTIMNNIDSVEALAREYKSLTGEGERIATMMRDTLANDIEIANSAFDAMRRDLASDTTPALRAMYQELTLMAEGIRLTANGTIDWTKELGVLGTVLGETWGALKTDVDFLWDLSRQLGLTVVWDKAGEAVRGMYSVIEEAQLAEEFKRIGEEVKSSMEVINNSMDIQASVVPMIKEYRELTKEFETNNAVGIRMAEIQSILEEQYGKTAIMINKETGQVEVNTAELERQALAKNKEAQTIIDINRARGEEIKIKRQMMLEEIRLATETGSTTEAMAKYAELWPEIQKLEQEFMARLPIIRQELVNTAQNGWSLLTGAIGEYNEELEKTGTEGTEALSSNLQVQVALAKLQEQRAKIAVDEEADILRKIELEKVYRDAQLRVAQIEHQASLESIKDDEDAAQKKEVLNINLTKRKEAILHDYRKTEQEHYRALSEMEEKALQDKLKAIEQNNRKILKEYKSLNKERLEMEKALNAEVERMRGNTSEWEAKQNQKYIYEVEERFHSEMKFRRSSLDHQLKVHQASLAAQRKRAEQGKLLTEDEEESVKNSLNAIADINARKAQQTIQVWQEAMSSIGTIFQELATNQQIQRENELKAVEETEKAKLEAAGDNAELRIRIEQEAEARRKEIQRKQAESEKRMALFNIAIRTAQGIMSALSMFPPNPILAGIIGAAGAAQALIVSQQEIPAFAEGTDNAPGGPSLVGDGGGAELVYDPKKRSAFMTPDNPTVMNLSKGSQVFTAEETKRMLRGADNRDENNRIAQMLQQGKIGKDHAPAMDQAKLEKAFEKAIGKLPVVEHNYDERGYSRYKQKINNRKKMLNKKHGLRW